MCAWQRGVSLVMGCHGNSLLQTKFNNLKYKAVRLSSLMTSSLSHYSLQRVLDPLKLPRASKYWKLHDNQRDHLHRIGIELGVKTLDDWYKFTNEQVLSKAPFIGLYYKRSLLEALKTLYPYQQWDIHRFPSLPKNYWKNVDNQKTHMDKIATELGIKTLDDWYRYSGEEIVKKAPFICKYYNSSLLSALQKIYPQHNWDPLRFRRVPQGFWKDKEHQRSMLERIGRELGVTALDDWYNITGEMVLRRATWISQYYNSSLQQTLKNLYPHHDWDPQKFPRLPQRYWQAASTRNHFQRLLFEWKNQYKIKQLTDWYHLPPKQVKLFQQIGKGVHGGVTQMLKEWFPDTNWGSAVQGSIPELSIQEVVDVRVHHKFGPYVVDIFVPKWNLAIEYQGEQHFHQNYRGGLQSQQERDLEKQKWLKEHNITLVQVPYSWNGTWDHLRATIRQVRPDLLPDKNKKHKEKEVNFFTLSDASMK